MQQQARLAAWPRDQSSRCGHGITRICKWTDSSTVFFLHRPRFVNHAGILRGIIGSAISCACQARTSELPFFPLI
jgi:hypothetical protein